MKKIVNVDDKMFKETWHEKATEYITEKNIGWPYTPMSFASYL